jgi:hypothetical protein
VSGEVECGIRHEDREQDGQDDQKRVVGAGQKQFVRRHSSDLVCFKEEESNRKYVFGNKDREELSLAVYRSGCQ